MLASFSVENFKGISTPVRLDLRPLTLLFGQNSAGKSSLLHALLYAREVFQRKNLDADRTLSAGDGLDLGGFARMVHGHDPTRSIVLGFGLDVKNDIPDDFLGGLARSEEVGAVLDRVSGTVERAGVAVTVSWAPGGAYVSRYEVSVNDQPFAALACTPGRGVRLVDHVPADFKAFDTAPDAPSGWNEMAREAQGRAMGAEARRAAGRDEQYLPAWPVEDQGDALPAFDGPLRLALPDPESGAEEGETARLRAEIVVGVFSLLLSGLGRMVREALSGLRYLGPTRVVPPRAFVPQRTEDPARWASGLAGWDLLHRDAALVRRVGSWFSEREKLGAGYEVELRRSWEADDDDPLVEAVRAGHLDDLENLAYFLTRARRRDRLVFHPEANPGISLEAADLGVGLTQLVPVAAAVLEGPPAVGPPRPVLIEHPELNLHPRVQAALGDLFIEGATAGGPFLIETHSEHLTLRLLRRIKEERIRPRSVGIWYVGRSEAGVVEVQQLKVNKQGKLSDPWPESDSLFDQDLRERYP